MRILPRLAASRLTGLIQRFPVVVVAGARQVGKTTLVRSQLADWNYVVFDPAVDVGAARADPDLFLDNHPAPLILDEVQFAPELVGAVKRRVDRDRAPGRFVLTGSQHLGVLKSVQESLAGRAVFLDIEGFSVAELAGDPSPRHWLARYLDDPDAFVDEQLGGGRRHHLDRTTFQQLWRGFLPEANTIEEQWVPDLLRSYVRTYVERDVRLLAEVEDWQQFGRFLRLAAALTAQEVNRSQFGRDVGVTPQTAQRWLAMLRATFQWFELPAFHGNAIKRISARAKGHFADTGLACSLHSISTPQSMAGHPLSGAIFESAVAAELRKLSASMATPPAMLHWRAHSGAEVDILLERDGRLHPIEVKLGSQPTRGDARGITAFRTAYPAAEVAPGLVIAPIERARRLNEIDLALPWDCA